MHDTLAEWLRTEDAFLLIAHVSPDGDTIGSCLALYGLLTTMGKQACVCCDQPVPRIYRFLPWSGEVVLTDEVKSPIKNAVAVDCADIDRMGGAAAFFNNASLRGNIDHHRTNSAFGEYALVDFTASATGELVFALWEALGDDQPPALKRDIATCLYTAICTDTGSFAYSNTTPRTFRIAAKLLECGVNTMNVNVEVFRTATYARTRLRGYVLSSIELYGDDRVGFAMLRKADMLRFHTSGEDVEGMIDCVRDIETVEIAVLLREASDDSLKCSFRSKRYVDVSRLAGLFGGGGHLRAAGCTLFGDMEDIKDMLLKAAIEAL